MTLTASLLLLAAALVAPASAQRPEPGAKEMSSHEAEARLAEYADCVVGRSRYEARVAAFLRTVPGTEGFAAAAREAADLTCLNDAASRTRTRMTMRLPPDALRDALYPALYRRQFGKAAPAASVAALPPLSLGPEFDGAPAALPGDYAPKRALGDCVARADPAHAHALLLSTPWSAAEDGAVEALRTALAGCLAQGQTVRLNRAALRAYTGEALYKLRRASAATAAG